MRKTFLLIRWMLHPLCDLMTPWAYDATNSRVAHYTSSETQLLLLWDGGYNSKTTNQKIECMKGWWKQRKCRYLSSMSIQWTPWREKASLTNIYAGSRKNWNDWTISNSFVSSKRRKKNIQLGSRDFLSLGTVSNRKCEIGYREKLS